MAKRSRFVFPYDALPRAKRQIAIHACPSNRNADERRWNVGHWASLINQLDADITFIGTDEDRPFYNQLWGMVRCDPFSMVGRQLVEVYAFILTVDCLVCVNSGIMHLGILADVPLVAIVGGTPARIILPERKNVRYIEDPELKWWDEQAGHTSRVSRLNEIMPEQVLEAVYEVVG